MSSASAGLTNADDNLNKRQLLFDTYPAAEAAWQQRRLDYVESIADSESKGELAIAGLRARRALGFLPHTDPKACHLSPKGPLPLGQARMHAEKNAVCTITC